MLASDIGRLSGEARNAALRRGIDNSATALFQHLDNLVTHTVPDTFQIDSYRAVELLVGNLGHRSLRCLYPGIVQCSVQSAVSRNDPVDHLLYSPCVGHVAAICHGFILY